MEHQCMENMQKKHCKTNKIKSKSDIKQTAFRIKAAAKY